MAEFLKQNLVSILAAAGLVSASAGLGYAVGSRISNSDTLAGNSPKSYNHEQMNNVVLGYLFKHGLREPSFLKEIREETLLKCKHAIMLVDPIQSQFLRLFLKAMQAKRCIEVGVFTGYNACSMAWALPEDGEVIACDIEDTNIEIGRPLWHPAAAAKIKVKIGPAAETLDQMIQEGQSGTFDMVFIDADKLGYDAYYERGLILLRPGGFICIDNAIWSGKVALDAGQQDESTKAIHALNIKMQKDDRIDFSLTQIGDGVALCRKR